MLKETKYYFLLDYNRYGSLKYVQILINISSSQLSFLAKIKKIHLSVYNLMFTDCIPYYVGYEAEGGNPTSRECYNWNVGAPNSYKVVSFYTHWVVDWETQVLVNRVDWWPLNFSPLGYYTPLT